MSRTITALFDTRADAEAGQARLLAASVDAGNVRIHDQTSSPALADSATGTTGSSSDSPSSSVSGTMSGTSSTDTGIWSSIKNAFLPDEDRAAYEEGMRRGGFVLSADVDEDEVNRAIDALEDCNSIDLDARSDTWRSEGWNAPTGEPRGALFGGDTGRATTGGDDVMPVAEEQLVVGKREVDRGGIRVRSYVTETPVHEQVRLRQERVDGEPRPVDRALDGIANSTGGASKTNSTTGSY